MSKAQTAEKTPRNEPAAKPEPADKPAKRAPADKAARRETAPAASQKVPDERDAAIARLERTLVEERQIATKLREENDALRFKGEVLEKSYSKQLADARQRNEVLQKEVDGHKSRFAELGSGAEDTLRMLADTRAELNRVTADLNQLKGQQGRTGGMPVGTYRQQKQTDGDDSSQTINALLSGAPAARGRESGGDSNLHQRVKSEQPQPLEEMVSPDLIFTKDDDDKKSR
jgi:chromosome segregation ATPase